ncbi:MAG: HemK-like protein [Candidatus Methanoperedens nitroreducens]|uniref:HemK-like protein n=1 Tax=Candidatus Methanoperedens nitratireducens TaxID=1392998 RepID=A0A0P7ZAR0_9EURY|nr:HemK2/MTQ2 family protein methyltransferase [Candidatus Methanoperedens sp. BLZ2]KAB2944513.1 MAG: methyltransferase [Candidatus Methanoperedens sp.]KPQ41593.1 MAG: HemK-like protein [Candidatus Methanoperedens sp. BLZ1]MBZ0176287.1 methyltransferase [Candidatus Methanoperedens nitroreducens]CAG1006898.1 cobalt-precorrin-6B (C15)-methyltransferase [Methanosarcinales archaeon]MCX9077220.1 class I SAM-dependent methyltransferase [Candidatus Methanoperedens sp.]
MNIHYKNTIIKTDHHVYEPAEDSFLLAEAALDQIKGSERILEVGCGSGIISAIIKNNTGARITGVDINPYAAACTRGNGVEAIRGDLLNCIKGKFDIIIFNPPYLPTNESERTKDWINIALDGGYDGRQIINRFLEDAGSYLADNGRILMLLSSFTGIEEVKSKMKELGYDVEEKNTERISFEQLLVIAARKVR